jgi:hypothetical protein
VEREEFPEWDSFWVVRPAYAEFGCTAPLHICCIEKYDLDEMREHLIQLDHLIVAEGKEIRVSQIA